MESTLGAPGGPRRPASFSPPGPGRRIICKAQDSVLMLKCLYYHLYELHSALRPIDGGKVATRFGFYSGEDRVEV